VNTHDRTVDHLHVAAVRLADSLHQSIPDARFAPAIKAVVGFGVGAIALWQIPPRRSRSQYPKHSVHDPAVVLAPWPWTPLRQHWLDSTPLEISEVIAHDPLPKATGSLNHCSPICDTMIEYKS
jgi:hypothetical protein